MHCVEPQRSRVITPMDRGLAHKQIPKVTIVRQPDHFNKYNVDSAVSLHLMYNTNMTRNMADFLPTGSLWNVKWPATHTIARCPKLVQHLH